MMLRRWILLLVAAFPLAARCEEPVFDPQTPVGRLLNGALAIAERGQFADYDVMRAFLEDQMKKDDVWGKEILAGERWGEINGSSIRRNHYISFSQLSSDLLHIGYYIETPEYARAVLKPLEANLFLRIFSEICFDVSDITKNLSGRYHKKITTNEGTKIYLVKDENDKIITVVVGQIKNAIPKCSTTISLQMNGAYSSSLNEVP